jgi:NADH dehydrogenase/NADH:ubiquinone oxidoreductase subunit G
VFQGHHLDPLNKNIKAIFPATTWFEKDSSYINCYGMLQKTKAVVTPPLNVRDDWKIIQRFLFHLKQNASSNYKIPFCNLKAVRKRILEITPILENNNIFFNKKKKLNFKSFNINSFNFIKNKLLKSKHHNYYKLTSVERASKTMQICSQTFNKSLNNYI